jgi:hypothetical protein
MTFVKHSILIGYKVIKKKKHANNRCSLKTIMYCIFSKQKMCTQHLYVQKCREKFSIINWELLWS